MQSPGITIVLLVTNLAAALRFLKGWATISLNALKEAKNHRLETGNPAENRS